MHNDDIAIIIPAYNEGGSIGDVVYNLQKQYRNVIVVDDGSKDNTVSIATLAGAKVLSHLTNVGQGGALQTGINYALSSPDIKYFVTFDADGQHRKEDIATMLKEIKKIK